MNLEPCRDLYDSFRLPCSNNLRHMSTDNFLMGLEDLGYVVSEKAPGGRREYRLAFNKAMLEAKKGVSMSMDMVVGVCQLDKN